MFKHISQIMADRFYSYTNLTFEALNLHREKFTLEKIVSQGLIRKDHVSIYVLIGPNTISIKQIYSMLSCILADMPMVLSTNQIEVCKSNASSCCFSHVFLCRLGIPLAIESQTSIIKLEGPSAYQRSSKCMKTSKKKIYFIKIAFVSISINSDMVLK